MEGKAQKGRCGPSQIPTQRLQSSVMQQVVLPAKLLVQLRWAIYCIIRAEWLLKL